MTPILICQFRIGNLGGAFGGTGQKCTASSRLIVHSANIHDAFVEKLVAGTQAMKVGHALEAGIQMGPVVSQQQLSENLAYVDLGKSEGAELACGGARLDMPHDGLLHVPRRVPEHHQRYAHQPRRDVRAPDQRHQSQQL